MPKQKKSFQTLPKGFVLPEERSPASPKKSPSNGHLSVSNVSPRPRHRRSKSGDLSKPSPRKPLKLSLTPRGTSRKIEEKASPRPAKLGKQFMSLRKPLDSGGSNDGLDGREAVKVVVRCRPYIPQDGSIEEETPCVEIHEATKAVVLDNKRELKQFTFDEVFGMESTQKEVLASALPIVDMALGGLNGTIFAYGQTSSGKTHTMMGNLHGRPDEQGIIPSVVDYMFEQMKKPSGDNTKYLLMISFLEIYNEHVRDLLGEDSEASLDVRQAPDLSFHVPDLSRHLVSNRTDLMKLIHEGNRHRTTSATKKNDVSSRSHSMLTMYIEKSTDVRDHESVVSAKLNLIDLAGSERLCDLASSKKSETLAINQSLACLANVISALTSNSASPFIPYRDSKLTKLLKDSLGGNAKTLMIACVNPSSTNAPETLSTLRYASRAKKIRNKPIVNQNPKDALMFQLQEEIEELRKSLNEKEQSQQAVLSMVKELGVVLEGEGDATNAEDRLSFLNSFIHTVPKCVQNAAALWHKKTFKSDKLMIKINGMAGTGKANYKPFGPHSAAVGDADVSDEESISGCHSASDPRQMVRRKSSAGTADVGGASPRSTGDSLDAAKEMLRLFQRELNAAKKREHAFRDKDNEIKELSEQLNNLKSEHRRLKRHNLNQVGELETMQDMLHQRLVALQKENKAQIGEIAGIRQGMTEQSVVIQMKNELLEKKEKKIQDLETMINGMKERQHGLCIQIEALQAELSKMSELQDQLATAEQVAHERQNECGTFKVKFKETDELLMKAITERDAALYNKEKANETHQKIVKDLEDKLLVLRGDYETLETQYERLDAKDEDWRARERAWNEEMQDLWNKYNELAEKEKKGCCACTIL